MKKFVALTLALASAASIAGCNTATKSAGTSGQGNAPSANTEEKTLRILTNVVGGKTPEEDALFAKEIEKKTGIHVELVHPPSDYDKKLLAAMASGEKYDVVYLTKPLLDVLAAQGALTPLNDRIQKSSVLGSSTVIPSDEWNYIQTSDKQIYGVPVKFEGGLLPIVRQDWMKKLGLSQPKTLDDFYQVLKAFKEKDPNGNGQKDTYGLTLSELYDIQPFMSAVGLKDRFAVDTDGKKFIPWATPAAVPVYQWLNKLYKEGILDPKFATNKTSDERNLFLSNRVGMFVYWDAWVGMLNNMKQQQDPNTQFDAEGILGAAGPDGKVLIKRGDPSLWAIPKNAPHPNTAFQFLEWWNTKPGEILGSLGIEGEDYTVADGKYQLTKTGKDHNMDHGDPNPMDTKWVNPMGTLPGYQNARNLIMQNGFVPMTTDKWNDAQTIVWHYGEEAIMGHMTSEAAVSKMHDELLAKHLIDK